MPLGVISVRQIWRNGRRKICNEFLLMWAAPKKVFQTNRVPKSSNLPMKRFRRFRWNLLALINIEIVDFYSLLERLMENGWFDNHRFSAWRNLLAIAQQDKESFQIIKVFFNFKTPMRSIWAIWFNVQHHKFIWQHSNLEIKFFEKSLTKYSPAPVVSLSERQNRVRTEGNETTGGGLKQVEKIGINGLNA